MLFFIHFMLDFDFCQSFASPENPGNYWFSEHILASAEELGHKNDAVVLAFICRERGFVGEPIVKVKPFLLKIIALLAG